MPAPSSPPASGPELGVVFRPTSPPERLIPVAEAAEQAGLAELWLWEDCFEQGGIAQSAAALARTSRIRVGIGVLPAPMRNPAPVAMELSTLARLWPGRFIAGFGHGVPEWMAQIGAAAESPMTLLREYTIAVRDLLRGQTIDPRGRYVRLEQVGLHWPPAQVPPILLGGRGPRTLRLGGEVADGAVLDASATADTVRATRDLLAEGRAAAGRDDPAQLTVYAEADLTGATAAAGAARLAELAAMLGDAGADTVVFQGPDTRPDPEPILAALAGG